MCYNTNMGNHKRILVVQEDDQITRIIRDCFKDKYSLTFQYSINKALSLLEESHYDLIILNTKNSTGNTLEIAKRIKTESESKLFFISTNIDIRIKEVCFEHGADDFLNIPFYPQELVIRSKRLLREYEIINTYVIERKGIQLFLQTRSIRVNKCTVFLSPTEFLIFEYLVMQDRYHKEEGLLNYLQCRKNKEMTLASVTVLINRLRQKLEKGTGMEIIKNRYGLGYYVAL